MTPISGLVLLVDLSLIEFPVNGIVKMFIIINFRFKFSFYRMLWQFKLLDVETYCLMEKSF